MLVSVYKDIWKIYYHTSLISKREKTLVDHIREKEKIKQGIYFYLFYTKERKCIKRKIIYIIILSFFQ